MFVLGAGSSVELGLPTGLELVEAIADRTNFDLDSKGGLRSGNGQLFDFARRIAPRRATAIGRMLSTGVQAAASIDNFLAAHGADAELVDLAKGAIVQEILRAERQSALFFGSPEKRDWQNKTVYSSWLGTFFHKLVNGVRADEIDTIFDNVRIINFNYDRCLEYFLVNALSRYFIISMEEAMEVVRKLDVSRPYGCVANYLPGSNKQARLPFGAESDVETIFDCYSNIRTFSEGEPDEDLLKETRAKILDAEKAVLLGLAYHDANMKFFCLGDENDGPLSLPENDLKRIYATTYGFSSADTAIIKTLLRDRILGGYDKLFDLEERVSVDRSMTCAETMRANRKSL